MALFARDQQALEQPDPVNVGMPDGKLTLTRGGEIRRLVNDAKSAASRADVPEAARAVVDVVSEMILKVDASLPQAERATPPLAEAALRAALEDCVRVGVSAGLLEVSSLRPKPGKTGALGHALVSFLGFQCARTIPRNYQILGNYLVRVGHYATRVPEASWTDILSGATGRIATALSANARYLVAADAVDDVWQQNIGTS